MGIKFDSELMKLMIYFESLTGSKVKDCISDDKIIFIIEEGSMGKAIGKNGANIKKIEARLRKRIKLVEFVNDPARFVKNFLGPIDVSCSSEDGAVVVQCRDSNSRAMVIGRERKNLKNLLEITKRYFDVKDIKVV